MLQAHDHLQQIGDQLLNLYSNVTLLWQYLHMVEEKNDSVLKDNALVRQDNDTLRKDLGSARQDIDSLRKDHIALAQHADTLSLRLDSLHNTYIRLDSLLSNQQTQALVTDSIIRQLAIDVLRIDSQLVAVDSLFTLQNDTISRLRLDQQQQQLEQQQQTIDLLTESLADIMNRNYTPQYLTDSETGIRYTLTVKNGQLTPQRVRYRNILAISNSFFSSYAAERLWWCDRAMAASTDSCTISHYLEKATGANVDILRAWDFEANYAPDYDFATKMPINKDYEVVIVQIIENVTYRDNMQESWEALYDYVREKCPNALIIQHVGWDQRPYRFDAVCQAAKNKQIPVVDSRVETMTGNFRTGDYVTDAEGEYHAIQITEVADHPSDVGMLLLANNMLRAIGIEPVDSLNRLDIQQTEGGTVTACYDQWPHHGLVSLMVEPNSQCTILPDGTEIETQRLSNRYYRNTKHDYFVFVMPEADVTIVPQWQTPEPPENPEQPETPDSPDNPEGQSAP